MIDKFHHECGIFGVYGTAAAAQWTCVGLHGLQHRGQESAGIAVSDGKRITLVREMGLVADVFDDRTLSKLSGDRAIGHVRYSTSGLSDLRSAQPFVAEHAGGSLAIAHNGNLIDAVTLRRSLEAQGSLFQSTSDSEVILHLLARAPGTGLTERALNVFPELRGAYSLLAMDHHHIVAVRDPWGFRPLVIAKIPECDTWVFSSESCAILGLNAEVVREVQPGEVVTIGPDGLTSTRFAANTQEKRCIFELVYFSRPDSVVFGESVYAARKAMGVQLASVGPVPKADVVIPVPDSGLGAALGYSQQTNIPYEMGLVRSHYVGRTFIEPQSTNRAGVVHLKLSVNREVVHDRSVVVVDDSLVRGTTAKHIITLVRQAGARAVHLRIASPPTRWPCFYGIDTPNRTELLAASMTIHQIAEVLGADSLEYLDVDGLHRAIAGGDDRGKYCDACFSGNYPAEVDPHSPPSDPIS